MIDSREPITEAETVRAVSKPLQRSQSERCLRSKKEWWRGESRADGKCKAKVKFQVLLVMGFGDVGRDKSQR